MLATISFYCIWFLAGLVTGLTSFGSNLIAVPFLTFVFSARESILIGCLSATCIFVALALIYWHATAWRETFYLVAGAMVSVPAGAWFLKHAGSSTLLFAAGFALVLFLAWQLALVRLKRTRKTIGAWFALPMGVASGALMGGVGMGGPPLVLFAYLRRYDAPVAISTINAASAAIMLYALPWQYADGLYNAELLRLGLLGGLAAIIGIIVSVPMVKRLDMRFFRKLLLLMLAISALELLGRAMLGL